MKLFTGVRIIFSSLILVGLVMGMQACGGGGGGGSTPVIPSNADPIGYYAGTLSTVSPSQTDINAKAIVDSTVFLLVHIDNGGSNTLLYKGTFTDITPTTFTADVRIYRNGAFLRTANITNGTITEKVSMGGTLSGTGVYTSTSFSLAYDTTINARTPLVSSRNDQWFIPANTQTGYIFTGATATQITNAYENITIVNDALKGCVATGLILSDVNSEQLGRIKTYTASYPTSTAVSGCINYVADFTMTGYMTTYDSGGTDNRYLWITYNDNNFFVEGLVKQ